MNAISSRSVIGCPYCVGGTERAGRLVVACNVCDGRGTLPRPQVAAEPHSHAWRIPTEDGTDYGVLVQIPSVARNAHHYYLLCPATATLYLAERDGSFDLTDCCDGEACDFLDDTHAKADILVRLIEAGEVVAPDGGSRDGGS